MIWWFTEPANKELGITSNHLEHVNDKTRSSGHADLAAKSLYISRWRALNFAVRRHVNLTIWWCLNIAIRRLVDVPVRRNVYIAVRWSFNFAIRRIIYIAVRRALDFPIRRALNFTVRRVVLCAGWRNVNIFWTNLHEQHSTVALFCSGTGDPRLSSPGKPHSSASATVPLARELLFVSVGPRWCLTPRSSVSHNADQPWQSAFPSVSPSSHKMATGTNASNTLGPVEMPSLI